MHVVRRNVGRIDGHPGPGPVPDAVGLVGEDAVAADLVDQQARGRQGVVADHLGRHPVARGAGQEEVLRVLLEAFLLITERLAIGRRHHHQLVHVLHVPARALELDGQVVQQLRMGRVRALGAEVLDRLDDAGRRSGLATAG